MCVCVCLQNHVEASEAKNAMRLVQPWICNRKWLVSRCALWILLKTVNYVLCNFFQPYEHITCLSVSLINLPIEKLLEKNNKKLTHTHTKSTFVAAEWSNQHFQPCTVVHQHQVSSEPPPSTMTPMKFLLRLLLFSVFSVLVATAALTFISLRNSTSEFYYFLLNLVWASFRPA